MLRILLLIIGILFVKKSMAQEWLPVGASWYYNQAVLFQGETYKYFEVSGDTTIQDKNCKILSGVCECDGYSSKNIIFQDADRIYLFSQKADSFRILYDFTLSKGDTMFYKGDPDIEGDGYYLIDSITSIQAGSLNLKVQHITWLAGYLWFGRKIIERIGSDACFFPIISFCDPGTGGLRCYEDPETGLINFQDPERPCDYISVGTSEPEEAQSFHVYPNPTSSTFNIESNLIIQEIELFNNLSKLSYQNHSVGNDHIELNVGHLVPGFYFIRIITSDNNFIIRPIIIQ